MSRSVPSVNRALDILELFISHPVLSAPQITDLLRLPRTTVHELLATLVERGYLDAVVGAPTNYRLGLRTFQLGSQFADRLDLVREAQEAAQRVAQACDETVHVAVLDGADVVYIAKVDSTLPVRMVSAVGRRLPAHCTAVGKVLLSGLSAEALDARYPPGGALVVMTPNSISSLSQLRSQLDRVRRDLVAYDDCESNDAVHCVAAPVYDHTGRMAAAISISVPATRWQAERAATLSTLVRAGAGDLSRRLGHPGGAATAAAG